MLSPTTSEKRKGATVVELSRLILCGHCPHPSNHVMEGFTNHLVGFTIAPNSFDGKQERLRVVVQFDSIKRISLRNSAFAFATLAVSACSSDLYRKARKGFAKSAKQTEPVPVTANRSYFFRQNLAVLLIWECERMLG